MKRIFILVSAVLTLGLSPAVAQDRLSPPHISINGEASLDVPPDTARIRAGVSASGLTARDASAANRKKMASVMAAIKAAGIAEKDVQTSGYSIQPIYGDAGPPPKITGFIANNDVILTIRKIDEVGGLIDKLTDAGANTLGGVEFTVSDAGKLLDKVRADALADAKRRAQIYADAAGMKIGGLLALSESVHTQQPMPYMMVRRAAVPETPIAAGENTLRVSVNTTFELVK